MKKLRHSREEVQRAATLFFMVRGLVRTKLAQGRRLDPYKWLRIETLVYIRDHEGASMKDVAAYLSITAPSATSLVGTLVREGLVERTADHKDKRALKLRLLAKGKRELAKAIALGMEALCEVFAPLSKRDLVVFTKLLARIKKGASV